MWLQYGKVRPHLILISQRGMGRALAVDVMRVIAARAAKTVRFIVLSFVFFGNGNVADGSWEAPKCIEKACPLQFGSMEHSGYGVAAAC